MQFKDLEPGQSFEIGATSYFKINFSSQQNADVCVVDEDGEHWVRTTILPETEVNQPSSSWGI